ncbi:hypothetical protein ACH4T9_25005 [Micromonospora sp. NPDC020750]|uniref:hypothetical protein n=1 Tax=unclassified Micromonospora TaxID=2617518 RepID=UPI0037BC2FC2
MSRAPKRSSGSASAYTRTPSRFAALAFAVARGEVPAASFASRVEARFAEGNVIGAVSLLGAAPGMLLRRVDRAAVRLDPALRQGRTYGHAASGRVLPTPPQ